MEITRTFELLDRIVNLYPKEDILSRKFNQKWIKYSSQEYYDYSHKTAYGLLEEGYKQGDNIITICNNRPEWNFIDMALSMTGMVHIPVYTTLSNDDYLHIFNHSDAKAILIGNKSLYTKLAPIIEQMDKPAKIILIDDVREEKEFKDLKYLDDIILSGDKNKLKYSPIVEEVKKSIKEDDLVTIIYTSGTTGLSKGVMLSHKNLIFNFISCAAKQIKNSEHKMLSFLPLCHIYERSMNYQYQYLGTSTYYAESLSTIASDMAECEADGFCAVPRVLEMMFSKLEAAGKDLKGVKKIIYKWAFDFATNFDRDNKSAWYIYKRNLAEKLVYSKWRAKMGGKEMLIVSGGSAIQAKIIKLFNAAKLYIFEGYGMTETSPVIAVNNPDAGINKIGTVGLKMEGTELKLAEDGEILTKGPHIMIGYYKDTKYTDEIIDKDGWLHTGDIGEFVEGKYLKITDRKKEIFKLSAGKYVAPQVIENKLRESSYIENCFVFGSNQKFASAIIVPDLSRLYFWAIKHKVTCPKEQFIKDPKIIAKIHKEIAKINSTLAPHECIKKEYLVNDEWSPNTGILSQTLKLKRNILNKKYSNIIEDIYKDNNLSF